MSNIVDNAEEYKKLALLIETAAKKAGEEEIRSGFIDDALLRLFYVKSIEVKLDKHQEDLTPETTMDVFEAVTSADETIQNVSDVVFEQIESYAADDKLFELEIDNTTVDLESKDKRDLLNQLYKCEGILRMARQTAARFPLYGAASSRLEHLEGIETDGSKSSDEKIYDDLGVDIYELLDVREKLVLSLDKLAGNNS